MNDTKPILFNTDMVRALLEDRKTVTRLVVKPQPVERPALKMCPDDVWRLEWWDLNTFHTMNVPICIGDILYVREAFQQDYDGSYSYRAGHKFEKSGGWRPSIHMPREAARIFLRVTNVSVERLQDSFFKHGSTIFSLLGDGVDIGEQCRECIDTYGSPCWIDSESECGILDEVRSEFADLWNRCYAAPRAVKGGDGVIDHYESYPWEDIQETRTYRGKPWYVIGNPWGWVIIFERISKEEAEHDV